MVKDRMTLVEMAGKAGAEEDVLRDGVKVLAESIIELEVREKAGAGLYERSRRGLLAAMATGSDSATLLQGL